MSLSHFIYSNLDLMGVNKFPVLKLFTAAVRNVHDWLYYRTRLKKHRSLFSPVQSKRVLGTRTGKRVLSQSLSYAVVIVAVVHLWNDVKITYQLARGNYWWRKLLYSSILPHVDITPFTLHPPTPQNHHTHTQQAVAHMEIRDYYDRGKVRLDWEVIFCWNMTE